MSLYSSPTSRRLCGLLWPAGGIFAPVSNRAERGLKCQIAVEAICRPVERFYCLAVPYITVPQNTSQRPTERQAGQKVTPAHSTRSKPGRFHFLRARDSTAQRSLSAPHQAQASLSQTFTCHTAASCLSGQNLFPSAAIVVSPPESH